MDAYTLMPDEVLLFKDSGTLKDQERIRLTETIDYELLLTNKNIVIIKTTKKMFSKSLSEAVIYPVENIKIYNDKPQIKQDGYSVEIYLTTGEIKFSFHSKSAARKLVTKTYDLITGTSAADRGAGKVKGAINRVDDTLGISTVGTVKTVLENGIARSLLGGVSPSPAKLTAKQSIATGALHIIKGITDSKRSDSEQEAQSDNEELPVNEDSACEPTQTNTVAETTKSESVSLDVYSERLELIAKMKSLVDAGVLTQEEFETKKKELLQL